MPDDVSPPSRPGLARRLWAQLVGHPIGAPVVIAAVVRVGVAVARPGTAIIPDETQYMTLAAHVAAGHSADSWSPGYGQGLYDSSRTFIAPLVQAVKVFGSSYVVGRLYVIVVATLVVALAAWFARTVLPPVGVLGVGVVLAVLPSQALFGGVVLREATVWGCLAVVYLAVARMASDDRRDIVVGAIVAGAAMLALGFVRQQTLVAVAWAMVAVVVVLGRRRFLERAAAVLVLLLLVPALVGIGPAGWTLISEGAGALGSVRASLSSGAATGIVGTATTTTLPGVSTTVAGPGALGIAKRNHDRVAEDRSNGVDEGLAADVRAAPAGLAASLVRPFPWDSGSSLSYTVAKYENLLWYVLYALAAVGVAVAAADPRRRRLLAAPLLVALAIEGIAALSQGNVGTAFRHRAQIAVPVVVFAMIGALWLADRGTRATPVSTVTDS